VPYAQSTDYLTRPGAAFTYLTIVARTDGDPQALAGALRRTVGTLDPDIPVADVQTMTAAVDAATARPRFLVVLLGAFAGAAVLLAAVGLYGVTSYAVSRRAQEIGVRIALGASRRDVVRLVVREGAGYAVAGTAAGAVAALALARGMRGLLFGVGAADPLTFVAVPLVLGAVVLAASWLPTRRAARVDPVVALRAE
jgi:putative ABC transport system permease protein